MIIMELLEKKKREREKNGKVFFPSIWIFFLFPSLKADVKEKIVKISSFVMFAHEIIFRFLFSHNCCVCVDYERHYYDFRLANVQSKFISYTLAESDEKHHWK
jgi:hypothetical protein